MLEPGPTQSAPPPIDVRSRLASLIRHNADRIIAAARAQSDYVDRILAAITPEEAERTELSPTLAAVLSLLDQGWLDSEAPTINTMFDCWHRAGLAGDEIDDYLSILERSLEEVVVSETIGDPQMSGAFSAILQSTFSDLRSKAVALSTRRLLAEANESRHNFETLFDNMPDASLVIDVAAGRILEGNPAAAELTGFPRQRLRWMTLADLQPGFVGDERRTLLARIVDEEYLVYDHLPLRRQDGVEIQVETRCVYTRYSGRAAMQVFLQDITERIVSRDAVEAQTCALQADVDATTEQLQQQRVFFENVISALPIRLLVIDQDLRVLHTNPAYYVQRGLSKDAVEGQLIDNVFPSSLLDEAGLRAAILSTLQTGERVRWSGYRQGSTEHSERIVNIRLDPCFGVGGQRNVLITMEDVTERHRQLYERSVLQQIARAMLGIVEQPRLLHAILTVMTAGGAIGLGFNRAILLLVDEEAGVLAAEMAVGPEDPEQASRIWSQVSVEHQTLDDFLAEYDRLPPPERRPLHSLVEHMVFPLSDIEHLPMLAVSAQETVHVIDAEHDSRVSQLLRDCLQTNEFVVAPLVVKDKVIGVAIADNRITGQPINQADVQLLTASTNLAAIGISSTRTHQQAQERAAELAEAYKALQKLTEQKIRAEKLAVIGELTAIVAHEVRNPLSTIGGFAHSIMRKPRELERVLRDAGIIVDEVERLESILRELLDFTKPQTPNPVPANVGDLASSVVDLMRDEVATHNVKIDLQRADDLPLARFDPNQIKQVIVNLIRNAVEAMPSGGVVTVVCDGVDGAARISVRDTGMGISKDRLDTIFGAFVTYKPAGTGLGLALAKKIVEDHQGTLTVESEEGKGTVFNIVFPPATAQASQPPIAKE